MEFKHLRTFLVVAEELHFGRAARRLNLAQPAVSLQVKALEEELGAPLFVRTSRSVVLTPAGVHVLAEARGILGRTEKLAADVRRLATGEAGRLAVGFVGPMLDCGLARAVRRFRADWPEVGVSLVECGTPEQIARLARNELDLGLARPFGHELSGLEEAIIVRTAYVLALPRDHALAGLASVPLSRLDGEPLILFPRSGNPRLYDAMLAALNRAGAAPRIVQETTTKRAALALVAAGLGSSFVPDLPDTGAGADVVLKPVTGGLPEVILSALTPAGANLPAARRFIELCREEAAPGV
jgi:DNA-binding transcriptional LysR family regulator